MMVVLVAAAVSVGAGVSVLVSVGVSDGVGETEDDGVSAGVGDGAIGVDVRHRHGAAHLKAATGFLQTSEDGLLASVGAEETGAEDDEGEYRCHDDEGDHDDRGLETGDAFFSFVQAAQQPRGLQHFYTPCDFALSKSRDRSGFVLQFKLTVLVGECYVLVKTNDKKVHNGLRERA